MALCWLWAPMNRSFVQGDKGFPSMSEVIPCPRFKCPGFSCYKNTDEGKSKKNRTKGKIRKNLHYVRF